MDILYTCNIICYWSFCFFAFEESSSLVLSLRFKMLLLQSEIGLITNSLGLGVIISSLTFPFVPLIFDLID